MKTPKKSVLVGKPDRVRPNWGRVLDGMPAPAGKPAWSNPEKVEAFAAGRLRWWLNIYES